MACGLRQLSQAARYSLDTRSARTRHLLGPVERDPPGGAGSAVAAEPGQTFAPRDERCKVPPVVFQLAAILDPDSLEGCGFFEDPNYHENRKANGTYNHNGPFSIIFG